MSRRLRLAFGRINQETNALSPVKTELEDFKAVHYFDDGKALMERCRPRTMEVDSMFRNAELSGFVQGAAKHSKKRQVDVEMVPCLSAWAVPSGPLTLTCFEFLVTTLCDDLRRALEAGPLDGVYLSLHGAMNVDALALTATSTPESEIVRRVREVVGDALPVAVSLDLHGCVVSELMDRTTFIQGYQTNPHRDHARVGARCARVLIDTALGTIKPAMVWRSLPMLLGGGNTVDFLKPLRAIFKRMSALDDEAGILGTTLMTVHPWNRHPELGWATIVAVDTLAGPEMLAKGEAAADELAEMSWAVRDQLPPKMGNAKDALERARSRRLRRKTGVVVISDASDVVSAGAPGENTGLIKAFIEADDMVTFAALRDPALVKTIWEEHEVGDVIDVSIGAKLDPSRGTSLPVKGRISQMKQAHGLGRLAVLVVKRCHIVVVEGPAMAVKPSFYKDAGLNPWKADVVMVKNFFPFLLFFLPLMRDVIFVRTSGVTDFDAAFGLEFAGPMSPRDEVTEWRSADRRRRGLDGSSSSSSSSSSSASAPSEMHAA